MIESAFLRQYAHLQEIEVAAAKLGFPFESQEDLEVFFSRLDTRGDGRITESDFVTSLTALELQE